MAIIHLGCAVKKISKCVSNRWVACFLVVSPSKWNAAEEMKALKLYFIASRQSDEGLSPLMVPLVRCIAQRAMDPALMMFCLENRSCTVDKMHCI